MSSDLRQSINHSISRGVYCRSILAKSNIQSSLVKWSTTTTAAFVFTSSLANHVTQSTCNFVLESNGLDVMAAVDRGRPTWTSCRRCLVGASTSHCSQPFPSNQLPSLYRFPSFPIFPCALVQSFIQPWFTMHFESFHKLELLVRVHMNLLKRPPYPLGRLLGSSQSDGIRNSRFQK